jgi:hypothetical protein
MDTLDEETLKKLQNSTKDEFGITDENILSKLTMRRGPQTMTEHLREQYHLANGFVSSFLSFQAFSRMCKVLVCISMTMLPTRRTTFTYLESG